MPNHVHGIIELVGANQHSPNNGNQNSIDNTNQNFIDNANQHSIDITNRHSSDNNGIDINGAIYDNGTVGGNRAKDFSPLRSPSKTIGSVVRGFKIGVTKWMRQNTDVHDVWQRNYYEHIIRNEQSYQRISKYIINNPEKWLDDTFYKK